MQRAMNKIMSIQNFIREKKNNIFLILTQPVDLKP